MDHCGDHDWGQHMRGRWGRQGPWQGGPRDAWAEALGEWWRGPAPRIERGQVRYLVLDALAAQPRHGYEVIQAIGEKSRGAYKPSPGVVYPTLQMLEELGLARTVAQGDRKVYEITDEGRRDLKEHADEVAEFYEGSGFGWEQPTDDVAHVIKRVGRVMYLFRRALHRGSVRPSTIRRMRSILDDTLSKLEELLSPEDM